VNPADDIRRRAAAGVALMGIRTFAIRLLALVATAVLARLLAPRDFGIFALALAITSGAAAVAEAGLGAALIRSEERPARSVLETLLGFQLLLAGSLAAIVSAAALLFGDVGKVAAVMAISMPIMAFRTPAAIVLERELQYRPLVRVEIWEALTYYGWAIATVAAGWGVWGLATAIVARSVVGTSMMTLATPLGLLRPRLSLTRLRGLLRFGAWYQAAGVATLLRDQSFNVAIGAIGGVSTLGLWSLASRLLQVPFLLFGPLWRVSYPAFSRLLAEGEEARRMVERSIALLAIGTGALLTVLVGSSPALVPVVFGPQWTHAIDVLPAATLGLMIAGPVSVVASGYLYATGDSVTVTRAVFLHAVALGGVALPLLPLLGIAAIGLGWLAAGLVEAMVLGRALSRGTSAAILTHLALPSAAATASAVVGWIVASAAGPTVASVILAGTVAAILYFATLASVRGALVSEAFAITGRALRASLAAR
jgi:O-antigen/teichoic acid export membrane protein